MRDREYINGAINPLKPTANVPNAAGLAEARVILEQWRVEYNQLLPHSALRYQTPEEFAARHNPKWAVVSKDLNNPKRLFTTASASDSGAPL